MATHGSSKTAASRMVTGLFRDGDDAERAYQNLLDLGYDRNEVTVVMSKETRERYTSGGSKAETGIGSKAAEGAGIGGGIGAALGALFGAIAAIGTSVAIPGLGLLVAGPLVASLAGAGAGGIAGGLIGALVGAGIPESQAREYEKGIREGGILISVTPHSEAEADRIEEVFKDADGELISR